MSLEHELLELEKRFWTGDTEFYRRHLNDECLVAFTQMAGVMSKDAIAATVKEGQRWRELEVTDASMLQLAENVALLTYRAQCHARERRALCGTREQRLRQARLGLEARFSSADADDEPVKVSSEPHSPRWRSRAERRHC